MPIVGWLMAEQGIGNPKFVPILKVPLIYQLLFLVMLLVFRKMFHRDPVDTFWTSDKRLFRDGIFNFIYVVALTVIIIAIT